MLLVVLRIGQEPCECIRGEYLLDALQVARWHRVLQSTTIPNGLFSIIYRCAVSYAEYVNNIPRLLRALKYYLSDI